MGILVLLSSHLHLLELSRPNYTLSTEPYAGLVPEHDKRAATELYAVVESNAGMSRMTCSSTTLLVDESLLSYTPY
jgi:hypothetical protein